MQVSEKEIVDVERIDTGFGQVYGGSLAAIEKKHRAVDDDRLAGVAAKWVGSRRARAQYDSLHSLAHKASPRRGSYRFELSDPLRIRKVAPPGRVSALPSSLASSDLCLT